MARLHRRYGKRRKRSSEAAPRRNPPLLADLGEWVVPGFGGFAVARFATRIASTQVTKWKPSLGKHAGAGVSVAAFLAAWFLAHRVKWLAKYHTPVTVGAAIAALQSLIQIYLPQFGWMIADATPELAGSAASATTDQSPLAAVAHLNLQPSNDDPNEYTYNDSFDAGRYSPQTGGAAGSASGQAPPAGKDDLSDLEIDDAIGQNQNLGVFSTTN
jgi:hypothetical protein